MRLGALNPARAARKGAPSWELDWSEEDLAAHKIAYEAESHARREAIQHLAKEVEILKELEQFTLRELPKDFTDYLKETKPLDAARED